MAKIVIDARIWGVKHTGPGRYTENVVKNLTSINLRDSITLLVRAEDKKQIETEHLRVKLVEAEARHYSVKEQLLLPLKIFKIKPDLLHIPHFNVPVFWPGRFVVTIHDLITHNFRGKEETTLPIILYWLKYFVHLSVIKYAVSRSTAIIVPTNWVKEKIIEKFNISDKKIFTTFEGVDDLFFKKQDKKQQVTVLKKYHLPEKYLIYTGNAYEHKNLDRLISAIQAAKVTLAIVCARSVFRDRFEQKVNSAGASRYVKLLGSVPDEDLKVLYQKSAAFVTASLSEGFGLPGLEAMASGTIVLSSNASCLPEVYGDIPLYFNPLNSEDIEDCIKKALNLDDGLRGIIIEKGIAHAKKFSWNKTARLTLDAYDYALNR